MYNKMLRFSFHHRHFFQVKVSPFRSAYKIQKKNYHVFTMRLQLQKNLLNEGKKLDDNSENDEKTTWVDNTNADCLL